MPGLVTIVEKISAEVVKRLAAASYPALADGKILMGRQHQAAYSSPPRIIMTPVASEFAATDVYTRQPFPSGAYSAESKAQLAQRAFALESVTFEIRCWGNSPGSSPTDMRDDDFDATQVLYHAVIQAMSAPRVTDNGPAIVGPLTKGGVELIAGKWTDASYKAPQNLVLGREFVFGVRIPTPVLDKLLQFAPSDVAANPTTNLTLQSGGSDVGCQG